ncbi:MAG TPA: HAD family phosphatase [Puia sp.]|jgi:2-haloacid dehalogenase|nr:HAD family phosphatase [Puia sp.]
MNNINTIIFDFGGVLIDWNPRYMYRDEFEESSEMEHFLNEVCTDDWNLQQDKGRPLAEGTRILQDKFPEHIEKIQLFYDQWEKMIKGNIPQNVSLLRKLKERYKLYGLTNWSAETFPIVFKRFPFFKIFDGIVISGEEKLIKPDKKIFELILERYQLEAKNSLFIDDNINNIQAAKEIGFATIHVQEKTDLKTELHALGLI